METNRFVTKRNKFNTELLQKHEGISRSILMGDSAKILGAMSMTARIDTCPFGKKDWSDDVRIVIRTLASTENRWNEGENTVINTTLSLSLADVNNMLTNLIEVRDELVALDNEVCEAFDIIGGDEDDDEDD